MCKENFQVVFCNALADKLHARRAGLFSDGSLLDLVARAGRRGEEGGFFLTFTSRRIVEISRLADFLKFALFSVSRSFRFVVSVWGKSV